MAKVKKNKIKTRKSVQKRFEITGSGKVTRYFISAQHLTEGKSAQAKGHAGKKTVVTKTQAKKFIKYLAK